MSEVKNSATHRRYTTAGYEIQNAVSFGSLFRVRCPLRCSVQRLRGLVRCASGLRNSTSGAPGNIGSNGYYWSDTPSSTANGRNLNFNSSSVSPQNSNNRANGFAVRCLSEFLGR